MAQDFTDNCFQADHVAQIDMANIEENFAALKSAFSGTTVPTDVVAGMWWHDTTNDLLKHYDGTAWQTVWDFGNECIPPDAIPADYVTSSMLNSTSGSEAVTTDVIRDAAITAAKLSSTALAKSWVSKWSGSSTGSISMSWGDGQYMVKMEYSTGSWTSYVNVSVNGTYVAVSGSTENSPCPYAGSGTIYSAASYLVIKQIWKWE